RSSATDGGRSDREVEGHSPTSVEGPPGTQATARSDRGWDHRRRQREGHRGAGVVPRVAQQPAKNHAAQELDRPARLRIFSEERRAIALYTGAGAGHGPAGIGPRGGVRKLRAPAQRRPSGAGASRQPGRTDRSSEARRSGSAKIPGPKGIPQVADLAAALLEPATAKLSRSPSPARRDRRSHRAGSS